MFDKNVLDMMDKMTHIFYIKDSGNIKKKQFCNIKLKLLFLKIFLKNIFKNTLQKI